MQLANYVGNVGPLHILFEAIIDNPDCCEPLAVYAAPGYEARPAADWEFIAYGTALDHVLEQQWLRDFAADRKIVFRANDLASQIAAARAGIGIAALPCFLAYQDSGLAPLSVEMTAAARDIYLIVHADLRRMPAVRAVLEFVAEQIIEGMPASGVRSQPPLQSA